MTVSLPAGEEQVPEFMLDASHSSMTRLEHFLDAVLKPLLHEEMSKRDGAIQLAAECNQLCVLFSEMKTLSGIDNASGTADPSALIRTSKSLPPRPQRNHILVNLGNHFYTSALVKDAKSVWLNVGCGVVLEMSVDAAKVHLRKREKLARDSLERQNQQILRLKFRIRLVTEAIKRLHNQCVGLEDG